MSIMSTDLDTVGTPAAEHGMANQSVLVNHLLGKCCNNSGYLDPHCFPHWSLCTHCCIRPCCICNLLSPTIVWNLHWN